MTRRSDFRNALNAIIRRANANEQEGIAAIRVALAELRSQIADRVTRGDINAASVLPLLRDIEAMIEVVNARMANIVAMTVRQAGVYGANSVVSPLQAINALINTTGNLNRLDTVVGFAVDLITGGLASDMRVKIQMALRRNALGDASPNDAMREIDRILGLVSRGGRSKSTGIFYEAERIVRTETGRAFNITAQDTLMDAANDDPNVKKRWVNPLRPNSRPEHIAAHMATLSKPVPANEPFIVAGEELMFPLDPNGSAGNIINCGCRMLTVYDDLGVIEMPGERQRLNRAR